MRTRTCAWTTARRPVTAPPDPRAAGTTAFAAPTAWGPAVVHVRGDDVVMIDTPAPNNDLRGARPLALAPAEVRELAARIAATIEGDYVPLASDEQVERWLTAAGGLAPNQHRMLATLSRMVPWGVTVTYGELAELAGFPRAARAAGTACARNPLALVVPCHRVVSAGGGTRGTGGFGRHGVEYKRRLLALEARQPHR
jgi:O-6-methylguanine DNA methyltransferase